MRNAGSRRKEEKRGFVFVLGERGGGGGKGKEINPPPVCFATGPCPRPET